MSEKCFVETKNYYNRGYFSVMKKRSHGKFSLKRFDDGGGKLERAALSDEIFWR